MTGAVKTIQALTRPGLTWLLTLALVAGVFAGPTRIPMASLELLYWPTMLALGVWFGSRTLPGIGEILTSRRRES